MFFSIFLSKILFFLPPPQISTSKGFFLNSFRDKDNSSAMVLAVKSVRVATPSWRFKPLAKDISKSFSVKPGCYRIYFDRDAAATAGDDARS